MYFSHFDFHFEFFGFVSVGTEGNVYGSILTLVLLGEFIGLPPVEIARRRCDEPNIVVLSACIANAAVIG